MLSTRPRSRRIALASVFAVLYSISRLIPIAPYVGISSVFTFGEALSPLAGILLGPVFGALSVLLGTFVDFGLGRPVVFDGLDFVPGAVAAMVAGLCFTERRKLAVAVPLVLMLIFSLDPLSQVVVSVSGVPIPYLWMHLVSVISILVAWLLVSKGRLQKTSWPFVTATFFVSTMSAHVAGGIVYENVLGRVNNVLSASRISSLWTTIFYLYPAERLFFTIAGTLVAFPILMRLKSRSERG